MLQFMKGGASSVAAVRGEYNAIEALPGFSYENLGQYGWHAVNDGSDDRDHAAEAQAGYERAEELIAATHDTDLTEPLAPDDPPENGMHMLILDEILYAAERDLVAPTDVIALIEAKPTSLELVQTGAHSRPGYLDTYTDLITNVRKENHTIDDGQQARQGSEY